MPAQLNQQTTSSGTKCLWLADHSTVLLIGNANEQLIGTLLYVLLKDSNFLRQIIRVEYKIAECHPFTPGLSNYFVLMSRRVGLLSLDS